MNSKICEILDIEFPLLAFSHCKDVVAQVSKAGGMGVLGAVGMTPEILEQELKWIDDHVDGKPYGKLGSQCNWMDFKLISVVISINLKHLKNFLDRRRLHHLYFLIRQHLYDLCHGKIALHQKLEF